MNGVDRGDESRDFVEEGPDLRSLALGQWPECIPVGASASTRSIVAR